MYCFCETFWLMVATDKVGSVQSLVSLFLMSIHPWRMWYLLFPFLFPLHITISWWYFFLFFWCYFRYTLRNAEYRLCLERNLDFDDGNKDKQSNDNCRVNLHEMLLDSANLANVSDENESSSNCEESLDKSSESINIQGIGETSPEVQQHILHLQFQLSSIKKVFILVSLVTLSLLT